MQVFECDAQVFEHTHQELSTVLIMLSILALDGGAIRAASWGECLKMFPHLRVLTCRRVAIENFLPHHGHLTVLALEGCQGSFGGIMGHAFPNLRRLTLAGFEGSIQHLLTCETLVYLRLRDLAILDENQIKLPPHLSTLDIDSNLLQTVRILKTAPRLHTLRVIRPDNDAGQQWPLEKLDMTSFTSIRHLQLGQQPSVKLSLPKEAALILHDCFIGHNLLVAGISSLRCVVLSGVHDLQEDLDLFFNSLNSLEELSIKGYHPIQSERFSKLPNSLLRFTVQHIWLKHPAAILTATQLIQLTIKDCQVEHHYASQLKLENLKDLRSLTVLRTLGLEAIQIPSTVHYYHDHSAK